MKTTLPNDYERMIPEYHKGNIIYGEHIVRYLAAQELLKDKVVLDIASGSGYGTQILAKNAKKVIGVDVSKESVAYSEEHFPGKNITYLVGDGENIPVESKSVDVVASFETIEHIKDYEKFLDETKRVLKDDGLLIISTPNDLEFAEGNHFHLHEFTLEELERVIKKRFKYTKSYFQGTWTYSALLDKDSISKEGDITVKTSNNAPLLPKEYLYFFMLCSNREVTESVDNIGSISEHWSARKIQEKQQLTDQHIKNISDILKSTQKHASDLVATAEDREKRLKLIESELSEIKKNVLWRTVSKSKKIVRKAKRS